MDAVALTYCECALTVFFLLPDHFNHSEGGHPAGYWLHGGEPELQARERCPDAGFLCGGEHFLPQVRSRGMKQNAGAGCFLLSC